MSIIKGLILSGGKGTRLRPITHTRAKQLVPIANKPILFYGIEAIRDAGVEDIGIVVGDTHEEIRAAVGDGSRFGVKVTYVDQDAPLGLAHAVKVSREYLGQDRFVMYLGDNLITDGITQFVDCFRESSANCQILLARVRNPQEFGVAEIEEGRVKRLVEKPKKPKSDLALVGVYMFDPTVFKAVDAIKPSFRDELEITDAIQYLIDNGYDVQSKVIDGWWKDTGKLEDILEANRIILSTLKRRIEGTVDSESQVDGDVVLEQGAEVVRSVLRGPLIIGHGTKVVDAYVGPFTSVDRESVVINSEIEHSIVLERVTLENLGGRMESSLIGKDVQVTRSVRRPQAFSMMVGDHSRIELI